MDVLIGVAHGSSQHGAQQALALGRALEEELAHSRQQRQPHRHRLVRKAAAERLQKVWRILYKRVASPFIVSHQVWTL